MKLLFCQKCEDLFRLTSKERYCSCGETHGKYLADGLHAQFSGRYAVPLFIVNGSFSQALIERPHSGKGSTFIAGVIPEVCDTMEYNE
jgi:hypothetical protein